MGSLRLDHVVARVEDLEEGAADYRGLGFSVVPGGEHPGLGSRNALAAFEDGSYLELIAFGEPQAETPEAPGLERWRRWRESPPGLVDFALLPEDLEELVAGARERGLEVEGPLEGRRRRPDGLEVAFQLGLPRSPDLPFLCADITPRERRVPQGDACRHPNQAAGIAELWLAVRDLRSSVERYQAFLDRKPTWASAAGKFFGFRVGPASIFLAAPKPGPLTAQVEARGAVPIGLLLRPRGARAEEGTRQRGTPLDPARTHGALISIGGGRRKGG